MRIAKPLLSRRHLSTVLAACAVLVAPFLLAGPPQSSPEPTRTEAPVEAPRIAVEPPLFDFGKVLPQKSVSRQFNIRNFGTKDLVVDGVTTSCGCTVTDPAPPVKMVVKPGGSGPLRVTLTTPANPGRISKSVLVKSNDPERATFEIKLQATVAAGTP